MMKRQEHHSHRGRRDKDNIYTKRAEKRTPFTIRVKRQGHHSHTTHTKGKEIGTLFP